MTIDYLPWNRPATLADRVCMRDLVVMAASLGEALKLGPDDNCLLVLPLFHVNAILVNIYPKEIESVLGRHNAVLEAP